MIVKDVARYYMEKLRENGPTPRGVDWNGADSQLLRFEQLTRVLDGVGGGFSVLDVGCGYGALADFLSERFREFSYFGHDICPEMVAEAKRGHRQQPTLVFTTEWASIPACDFVIASGIFNVRLTYSTADWEAYTLQTLAAIDSKAGRGWSVNFLTSYSDSHLQKDYLYYADPCFYFDWCKRNVTGHVAVLHDYGLYEFTLIARKALG